MESTRQDVRYCDRCGAQIEGAGSWGHDDNCVNQGFWRGEPDPRHDLVLGCAPTCPCGHGPCPTCQGLIRETVEMVCQTCGRDYSRRGQ